MRIIWSLDGTLVYLTGVSTHEDPAFEGIARDHLGTVLQWTAWPKPQGYEVHAITALGRRRIWAGGTFNLALEVAACVNNGTAIP